MKSALYIRQFARLCIWIALFISASAQADSTLLTFAQLIDGNGEVLKYREIVVENGRIREVGNDLGERYPLAKRIHRDDLVALPGLIDVHVHITYGLIHASRGDAWTELFSSPAIDRLVAASRHAQTMLQIGVTTARDLTSFDGVDRQLKALIDNNVIPGPRLFLSGTGIHPSTLRTLAGTEQRNLVKEFSEVAEQRISEGADWLKIFATTGSADDLSDKQNFFYSEIKAATDIAHAAGLRVAVHSYGPSAVSDALRAGVDSIEHPAGLTDELISRWLETETVYVPTIDHNRYYAEFSDEYGYTENTNKNLWQFIERNLESLRMAHKAGIRIAMGSDSVMSMFGQNTRELEWFVKAGMSNAEALSAATLNGAILLGQQDFLGRLKPGFAADIVAVKGNPLEDIRAVTQQVKFVMKAGNIIELQ